MTPKKIKMKFLTLPGPSLFNTSFVYRPFLPLSNLHLGDFCGFQRNLVYGLALALVGHCGIDLGGGDILVAKDMLDGIDAGASLHLQRAQGMAGAMTNTRESEQEKR